MKIRISLFIIASFIGAILFFYSSSNNDDIDENYDSDDELPVLIVENKDIIPKPKEIKNVVISKNKANDLSKIKNEVKEETGKAKGFDLTAKIKIKIKTKIEQKWRTRIKHYFIDSFKLTPEDYDDYIELRDEFKKDRDLSYSRYVQKMEDQYGDDYKNNPDAINEVFINENYKDFIASLSVIIGQENINEYFMFKSEYNDSVEEMLDDDDEEEYLIEY